MLPYINSNKWNEEIDLRHGGVSIHLGQIADIMYEWEGPVAEYLGLTRADIAAIKTKYPRELKLRLYVLIIDSLFSYNYIIMQDKNCIDCDKM